MGELRGLARVLARDADVDDAVQDTAVVALSQRTPPTSIGAWLRQVLRNGVRGRVRHRRAWDHRRFDPLLPEIPETPEQCAETIEIFDLVRAALDDLEEPYRTTIRRRFFEGLSPADIARSDGEPPTTVRWRVHEGLRRLRARLDDRCGGRERWCGALAFAPFTRSSEGTMPMMQPLFTLSLLATSVVALAVGVTVAVQSRAADDGEITSPSRREPSTTDARTSGPAIAADAADPAASCEPEAEPVPDDERKPMQTVLETVLDCLEAAPEGALVGATRLEFEMRIASTSAADEPLALAYVHATHGRKVPCADGVMEASPIDAPGVVRHREIEECVASSLDLERFRSDGPAPEGQLYGFQLNLDGHGRPASDDDPPWTFPELPKETIPDPSTAVAALALPVLGATDGDRIEIVACGEYSCPFSRKGQQQLDELRAREPRLAIAWLQFPAQRYADGLLTASAGVAAGRQGRFWEMHRALFEHDKPMDRADVIALAATLGLDAERFATDLDDPATAIEVGRQQRVCAEAGVNATPTFFVQGDLIPGAIGADGLAHTIAELAE